MHTERVQARASAAARKSNYRFGCDCLILLVMFVFGASVALADPEPKKTSFDIEAQPASTALALYARQARVQLGFAADIVEDIVTNSVKGEYGNAQALELLLEGTGLEAEQGDSTIIIRLASEGDLTSSIEEPASAVAGADRLQLRQTAARAPSYTPISPARNASTDEDDKSVKKREEIVVTGSRIRGAQDASPVVTITREQIDQAGFATVEELVDKLPQNFGAGASLDTHADPTVNTINVVGGDVDSRGGATSVNLRGLGSSATLVLLNGHRLNPSGQFSAFTNISSIPVTAIERVEILTDGASAIYGSDAIAGVVNFILREDYEGAETRLRYGVADGGTKPEILLGQSFGVSWDAGNALFIYEYYDTDNLASSDRDFTASNDLSRFGGTDYRPLGGNPANITAGGQTFPIPSGQDGTALTPADFPVDANGVPAAQLNRHNSRTLDDVMPTLQRHSALLHLKHAIGPSELFGTLRFSTQETDHRTTPPLVDLTVTQANPFFVDPTGTGLTTVVVEGYSLADDIGAERRVAELDSMGATFGVRFDVNEDWTSELVGSWAREDTVSQKVKEVNIAALEALVNPASIGDPVFNPFGDGSNTDPGVLESIIGQEPVDRPSTSELTQVNLNFDGSIFDVPGGDAKIVAGIEFRKESRSVDENFFTPALDLDREILATYAELFFPLVSDSNSRPGLRRLVLSLAARYEDYSDFGNSVNPKVGLVWSPTASLLFRGTYSTSFKAPALRHLDASAATSAAVYFPQFGVDLGQIPFPLIFRVGGNPDLDAEEATTWTAGIEWDPELVNGLSLNLTYFNLDFHNRIDRPSLDFRTATTDPRFSSIFNTSPTDEEIISLIESPVWIESSFGVTTTLEDFLSGDRPVGGILDLRFANLSKLVVTGAELQLSYGFETALGSFNLGLNGSYLFDFERQFIESDPIVDEVDRLGRPVDFRARGSMSWDHGGWNVSTFINYTDSYTDNVYEDPARSVGSWTTVDLSVGYDVDGDRGLFTGTRWSMSVQNLFNEDPPFVNTFGGLGYDTANASPVGRVLALQVTKNW